MMGRHRPILLGLIFVFILSVVNGAVEVPFRVCGYDYHPPPSAVAAAAAPPPAESGAQAGRAMHGKHHGVDEQARPTPRPVETGQNIAKQEEKPVKKNDEGGFQDPTSPKHRHSPDANKPDATTKAPGLAKDPSNVENGKTSKHVTTPEPSGQGQNSPVLSTTRPSKDVGRSMEHSSRQVTSPKPDSQVHPKDEKKSDTSPVDASKKQEVTSTEKPASDRSLFEHPRTTTTTAKPKDTSLESPKPSTEKEPPSSSSLVNHGATPKPPTTEQGTSKTNDPDGKSPKDAPTSKPMMQGDKVVSSEKPANKGETASKTDKHLPTTEKPPSGRGIRDHIPSPTPLPSSSSKTDNFTPTTQKPIPAPSLQGPVQITTLSALKPKLAVRPSPNNEEKARAVTTEKPQTGKSVTDPSKNAPTTGKPQQSEQKSIHELVNEATEPSKGVTSQVDRVTEKPSNAQEHESPKKTANDPAHLTVTTEPTSKTTIRPGLSADKSPSVPQTKEENKPQDSHTTASPGRTPHKQEATSAEHETSWELCNVTLGKKLDEKAAKKLILDVEPWMRDMCEKKARAAWAFATDPLDHRKQEHFISTTLDYTNFRKEKYWGFFNRFNWRKFKDFTLRRQFRMESNIGISALSDEKFERYTQMKADMTKIFTTARICSFENKNNCNLQLEPEVSKIVSTSRNPDELQHYWKSWHDATGKPMSPLYQEYVDLSNQAAVLNGFRDNGEMWRYPYEDPTMPFDLWELWGQLRPFYENLHAFVRRQLGKKYGANLVPPNGTMPAHLLGNLWGQDWSNIWDIVEPHFEGGNGVSSWDITPSLIEQNYTIRSMYEKADDFFNSMDLQRVPHSFWKESVFEKPPPPRELMCETEIFDMCNTKDYFIKMCTTRSMKDFIQVHHEMGHVQYFMQYSHQVTSFRGGANPGFHEAVADAVGLAVASPTHLNNLKLLKGYTDNDKNTINYLLGQALKMFVDLPWDLVLEQWRWDVFSGKVKRDEYNCHWWTLRSRIQGVHPPLARSWEDFDPGSKYHVPNNIPYDRYFVARLLAYQMYEALCKTAGQYGSGQKLHLCSFFGSKEAGKRLEKVLKLGSTVPWPSALISLTEKRGLKAEPLLNYYEPLIKWLEQENQKSHENPGWDEDTLEEICLPKYPYP